MRERKRNWRGEARALLCLVFFLGVLVALAGRGVEATTPYILGPGDLLTVTVWGYPDLTGEVLVRPDGKIAMPLVGEVQAEGSTPAALGEILARALAKYLRHPQVTVSLKQARLLQIQVLGEVVNPGLYSLPGGSLLSDALAAAGGVKSATADLGAAILVQGGRREQVDLAAVLAGKSNRPLMQGDTLLLPALPEVIVLGEVAKPGVYRLPAGESPLRALALAGGLTAAADQQAARLTRMDGTEITFDLRQNSGLPALAPGDVLYIPRNLREVVVLGEVKNPGRYPLTEETRVLTAIALAGGTTARADLGRVAIYRAGNPQAGESLALGREQLVFSGAVVQENPLLASGDVVYVPETRKPDWNRWLTILSVVSLVVTIIGGK